MKNVFSSPNNSKGFHFFSNVRILCCAAFLAALAVAIAYVCKFLTVGSIRITFENLPIILSGYLFGPWAGLATGLCADLVSTAVSQYGIGGINPIITAGAASVGFFAGLMPMIVRKKGAFQLAASVAAAHFAGNMIIKSIGLAVYYSYPVAMLLPRIPLYATIGAIEYSILYVLLKSRGVNRAIGVLKI